MNKSETRLYGILVLVIWCYLGVRSALVPVVHDEAATFLHYLQLDQYIPYFALWDANNHILNSALGHLSVNLFDNHVFWLRLPNLLSFGLYAFYLYRLANKFNHKWPKWFTLLAMLSASFLIEFFALARGYGMSMAFLIGAIYHASAYMKHGHLRDQGWLWGFMFLALLANMSLFNSLIVLLAISGFGIIRNRPQPLLRHVLLWVLVGGSVLALSAFYAIKMKVLGLLYTGSLEGFVEVTAFSFARFQFGLPSVVMAWVLTLIGLLSSGLLLWHWVKREYNWTTGTVVGAVLLFNGVGAVLLASLLDVNYPDERTALYFLMLFILAVGFAADESASRESNFQWLALPLIYFPVQLSLTANTYTSQLWGYLHVDREIYHRAAELQSQADRPLRISGGRMYELSWAYDNIVYGGGLQLMERIHFPDSTADLLIARDDQDFSEWNADTLFYNLHSGFALLRPGHDLELSLPDTVGSETAYSGSEPYYNIAVWSPEKGIGERGMLAFSFRAQSFGNPLHAQIIITSQDSSGNTLTYDGIPLYWIRKHWQGDRYEVRRYYEFPPEASRAIVYLWNNSKESYDVAFSEVVRMKGLGPAHQRKND